jgi:signal transduction histidine kinase/CheY-like chemotaxis protein
MNAPPPGDAAFSATVRMPTRPLADTPQDPLAAAVLEGQRVRSVLLARVFAAAAALLTTAAVLQMLLSGATVIPLAILPFPLLMALQQTLVARLVQRRIRGRTPLPAGVWHASAFAEITLVTGGVLAAAGGFPDPAYALLTPAVLVYFVLILFSTLGLDGRTSLLIGAVAGAQYLAVSLILLVRPGAGAAIAPLFASPVPYAMKALLLVAAGGGAAFVARELRERIRGSVEAARARERSETADRAKSVFLAHMSHEIRSPLNTVLGYAHLLEADPLLSGEQRHAVSTIGASGRHLRGVVDQVLDLSRIEAGVQELAVRPFQPAALLRELSAVFEFRCRQKGLAWQVRGGTDEGMARGDECRLRQVLVNLLENAVRETATGAVRLEVTRSGERVRFGVVDSGPGIPPDRAAAVFEPFRRLHADGDPGGTGLGLAIARAQAERMGGSLTLDPEPGGGSRFTLEVPLPPAAAEEGGAPPAGAVRLAGDRRVAALVVAEAAADGELMAALLASLGVEVRPSAGAGGALAALRGGAADVAFFDFQSPGEADPALLLPPRGTDAPERCRTVAVSASVLEHERRALLAAGFDAVLPKPVSPAGIAECLAALLDVSFVPAAAPAAEAAGPERRPPAVPPRELRRALRAAAESCSVTELEDAVDALAAAGPELAPLVEEIRALSRRYDMDAIVALVDGVPRA